MCDSCKKWSDSFVGKPMPIPESFDPVALAKYHKAKSITDPAKLWKFMPTWIKSHMKASEFPKPNAKFDMRQYIPGIGYIPASWPKIPGVTLAMPLREDFQS